MEQELDVLLTELGALSRHYQECIAPYQAQIQALEMARDEATAALTFQIDTLQARLRPLILAEQRTRKVNGCTAIYCHKETWDNAGLRRFAEEVPTVLQCLRESSYVTFRLW
jgi:hypothetical protein